MGDFFGESCNLPWSRHEHPMPRLLPEATDPRVVHAKLHDPQEAWFEPAEGLEAFAGVDDDLLFEDFALALETHKKRLRSPRQIPTLLDLMGVVEIPYRASPALLPLIYCCSPPIGSSTATILIALESPCPFHPINIISVRR